MTVRATPGAIALEGDCPLEEAEALLRHLLDAPGAAVDWTQCDSAHAAVIQVLIAAGSSPRGPPAGAALRKVVFPAGFAPQQAIGIL